ncbi:cytochrome P450 [Vitiosangium sp. GDMCC 1.1324]|uniref:cytochrome P450 n=1 Tax=Vitiosangium sp. (strain GDMCC 1.1324) TaxID=2138576 RepID=UPI000D364F2D|nr:cytochrome P450 [Vitiosangium sp. GDMCC 1.1324]PTL75752.1 cytochrome P450 [Vitiosangium sp. GDMCC 1.1324]
MSTASGPTFNRFESPHLENPYPLYGRIRREAPVFFDEALHLWIVSRHQDVRAVLMAPETFSSLNIFQSPVPPPPEVLEVLMQGPQGLPSLIDDDPPNHTRVRTLVGKAFAPQRFAALEPRIRALARSLLDAFAHEGQGDLVSRFTYPLPALVIGEIMGVPHSDMDQLKRWAEDLTLFTAGTASPQKQVECARSFVAFQRYLGELVQERRREPKDDLVSAILQARHGDLAPMSDAELVNLLKNLHFAGHETTTNLLGNMLVLLLQEPERWRELQADRSLLPKAIEEALRMDSPVQGIMRTTTREVELGGERIPAGARLVILFASANRDENVFAAPERYNPRRADISKHLGFGLGIHYCIGAPLARLEARVALELLGERLRNLRLLPGEGFDYLPNFSHRGPRRLMVAWDPA